MLFGSLFAGVGGLDLGFERAGMKCAWQVEKDPDCLAVLRRHWPDVPKFGDVFGLDYDKLAPVDLICGGFPCVSVSVAGARAGLAASLWSPFVSVLEAARPEWVVVENVPGLLSSGKCEDFPKVLSDLHDLGYRCDPQILDALDFGVPQRRRRVFLVAQRGLPCRDRQMAKALARLQPDDRFIEGIISCSRQPVLSKLVDVLEAEADDDYLLSPRACAGLLRRAARRRKRLRPSLEVALRAAAEPEFPPHPAVPDGREWVGTLATRVGPHGPGWPTWNETEHVTEHMLCGKVRRLTPEECEKLQGLPVDHTAWGLAADGSRIELSPDARNRQTGNAVCVPVAAWIARRIMDVVTPS